MSDPKSTYLADKILGALFKSVTFPAALANSYASLHTADPGKTGANELTSTNSPGYARIAIVANTGWTAIADMSGGRGISNVANITFPAATTTNKTLTAATTSGSTATFTSTAHGYANGDYVTIAGVTPTGYNGAWGPISNVAANTFDIVNTLFTGLGAGSAFGVSTKNWLPFSYIGLWDALTTGNFLYGESINAAPIQVLNGEQWYEGVQLLGIVESPTL